LASLEARANPNDVTLAQSLFEEARKLMAQKRYAEACPKLAESQRLDPGGGTLLNLAACHEGEGKTATAWTDYNEALSLARRDNRKEREARARERIAALAPRLPHLTVKVAAAGSDVKVMVDGTDLGRAAWGTRTAMDPGTHVVVATAT